MLAFKILDGMDSCTVSRKTRLFASFAPRARSLLIQSRFNFCLLHPGVLLTIYTKMLF